MNSPGIILTVIGSAIFVAVMFGWKQVMTGAVNTYGPWIAIPIVAIGIGIAWLMDRKPKKPTDP